MTVTFNLRNGENEVTISNNLVVTSDYIKGLLEQYNISNITIDVPVTYTNIFYIYFKFLNGNNIPIDNLDTLLLCFRMESYFADNKFFEYLMLQTYTMWSTFYPHISELPDERLVYLYTPYEFVPIKYMNNPSFFKSWLQINQNKQVTINNGIYHTDTTYYDDDEDKEEDKKYIKELDIYHTINNVEIGYCMKKGWHTYGQLEYLLHYFNGEKEGLQQRWYENGQLLYRQKFVNGNREGLQEGWYKYGQLQYREHYVNGYRDGLQEAWYSNGQLQYTHHYINGKQNGLQQRWYDNGQFKYRNLYNMGVLERELSLELPLE